MTATADATPFLFMLSVAIPNMWNVINAASGYAQLAGILAGFVFISLTMTIATPRSAELRGHVNSSLMLSTAFILLLISSLMFTIISGDLSPYRATFLAAIAAAALSMGTLFLMSGTTWLLYEYMPSGDATKNFRHLSLLVFAVVAAFMMLVIADILQWAPERYEKWLENWLLVSLVVAVIAAALLAVGYVISVRLLGTETARDKDVSALGHVEKWTRAVSRASMVLLLLSALIWMWLLESENLSNKPGDEEFVFGSAQLIVTNWLLAVHSLVYVAIMLTIPWQRYRLSEV
jgi:MFS family permease